MVRPFWCVLVVAIFTVSAAAETKPSAPWEIGEVQPSWADQQPRQSRTLRYDPARSERENGDRLVQALKALGPGDQLLIGSGRYVVGPKFNLDLAGTEDAPIWIQGADSQHLPVITRPDARQNLINLGERSATRYVCLRDLELTGGSTLIRFYDCHHLWLDRCHLHDSGAEGITANSRDTSHLFITRNHFHDFTAANATGEAMYLGANHGKAKMSYSVIANNHVYNCAGQQGDGIEVKQGSHHNWIVGNHIHDTKYPCIIVYGTEGNGINLVERNVCYRSRDNTMQVQGDALVRNNLLMSGAGAAFASTDHQGKTANLRVIHNTLINASRGANLSSWDNRENLVLANNAIYSQNGAALRFPRGSRGVTISGNVIFGQVQGTADGFIRGAGLQDFVEVTWDAESRRAMPSGRSRLFGAADQNFRVDQDILGRIRSDGSIAGAFGRALE